jgi:hypothetical protein
MKLTSDFKEWLMYLVVIIICPFGLNYFLFLPNTEISHMSFSLSIFETIIFLILITILMCIKPIHKK